MVPLSAVGVNVLLTMLGQPCQQWILMFFDRVALSAVGVDVLMTVSLCKQWVLSSYLKG